MGQKELFYISDLKCIRLKLHIYSQNLGAKTTLSYKLNIFANEL